MKKYYWILQMQMMILLSNTALASRLEEAAQRGQSLIIEVGQVTSVIGIVIGGICLSLGLAGVGRMVLSGGFIGAAATYGAPAIIDFLKNIFH